MKADGRYSKDVGKIVGMSHVSVNGWLSRYKSEGMPELLIKAGRGCKPKIVKETDETEILTLAKRHRQRLQTAKLDFSSTQYQLKHSAIADTGVGSFLRV